MRMKAAYFATENETLFCCDVRLKASNAVAGKPKYDESKRSSQLRTLLKRVVVNETCKNFRPVRNLNP